MKATVKIEQSRADHLEPGDIFRPKERTVPSRSGPRAWYQVAQVRPGIASAADTRRLYVTISEGTSLSLDRFEIVEIQRDHIIRGPEGP